MMGYRYARNISNQDKRQSSKKNNKYQFLYTYGCASWWWAIDTPETCTGWRNILTISCASGSFSFTRQTFPFIEIRESSFVHIYCETSIYQSPLYAQVSVFFYVPFSPVFCNHFSPFVRMCIMCCIIEEIWFFSYTVYFVFHVAFAANTDWFISYFALYWKRTVCVKYRLPFM